MYKFLSTQLAEGATLIVDNRLAAVQLESFLACEGRSQARAAWPTPSIFTRGAWAAELWSANRDADRLLLSAAQSEALWRRVVSRSDDVDSMLHIGQVVAWATEAWRLLFDWRVDIRLLRAREEDSGFGYFLRWAGEYAQLLAESGWLDPAELNDALRSVASRDGLDSSRTLVWADIRDRTPSLDSLASAFRSAGHRVAFWEPIERPGAARRVGLADAREELCAAMLWAQRKLKEHRHARIALVFPPDRERELLLARGGVPAWGLHDSVLDEHQPVVLEGPAVDRDPAIGAALDCLELFSSHADIRTLSRFLRSPFLGATLENRARRSMIEVELRGELMAQLGFLSAYRSGELKTWLAQRAPATAAVIEGLLQRLATMPRYQSATQWARFAQDVLTQLGWPGAEGHIPAKTLDTWNQTLTELALLTPVVGAVDLESALAAIKATAARSQAPAAAPLAGITVLSRPEQVGLGYDAAWIAGMTDRAWPRQAQPNPLLPLGLQSAHKMPFATPADALLRCQEITSRLVGRIPEIVFSYTLVENDYAAEPSPLLREFELLDSGLLQPATAGYYRSSASAPLERIDDPLPPLAGNVIPGGASTLAVQARCPLRAFVLSRLLARPLEPLTRGISPRQRGIVTHRVLELLFAECAGRRELAGYTEAEIDDRLMASVRRALNEQFRGAAASLRVYRKLERDRLVSLARSLLSVELARDDFTIEGLELTHVAEIADFQIGCRIDRIDRLSDGRLVIIDYKTGQNASPSDWLKPRLLEPQLPLYLQIAPSDVGAMVFGVLQIGRVNYKGFSDLSEAFPGRMGRLPAGVDWVTQRDRWRAQLTELVTEFAAGDSRIFVADFLAAAGPLAPLTRVYDQLIAFREELAAEL